MATVNKLTAIYTQLVQARVTLSHSPVTVTSFSLPNTKNTYTSFTFKACSHQVSEQNGTREVCEPEIFLTVCQNEMNKMVLF